jgi:MFS transporter, DHA2 family, multidrug resistance protein
MASRHLGNVRRYARSTRYFNSQRLTAAHAGSFSASTDEVTWIFTSYIVANGIMIPLTGGSTRASGRKRYFLLSMVVFMIASGLCGAAAPLTQIVIFRLL